MSPPVCVTWDRGMGTGLDFLSFRKERTDLGRCSVGILAEFRSPELTESQHSSSLCNPSTLQRDEALKAQEQWTRQR